MRNKFDFLCEQIKGSIDIFMISESKLDESFPQGQFLIDGFHTPFRFDRNRNGGGILLFVREDIPAKVLSHGFPSTESFFVEIILHKKKWLINCSYNPTKNNIKNHLETISRALDTFSTKYENLVLLGDFNVCVDDENMKKFCNFYSLKSLIKQPTCYKNTLNKFFSNIVKNLKIPERFVNNSLPHSLSSHPTLKAILKYRDYPSIPVIKRFSQRISSFYFSAVDKNTVLKEIKKLNSNKAVQDTDIPVKILKENAEFFAEYIYLQFNEAIKSPKFPDFFKFAPAFKQGSRNQKDNYRPISILPLSKIFEKLICSQLSNHFDNILSKFQCGFRRGYGPQHCLLLMIDK